VILPVLPLIRKPRPPRTGVGVFVDAVSRRLRLVFRDGTEVEYGASGGAPDAHATSHKAGGDDEVSTTTPVAGGIPQAGATGFLDAGWGLGLPLGRVAYAHAASGTSLTSVGGGSVSTTGGTGSFIDATGAWASRGTGASSGSAAAWLCGTPIHRLDQTGGRCAILFRGAASMAAIRFWVGWFSTSPGNSDTMSGSGVGVRFSTVAGDAGFMAVSRDGTNQTLGANLGSVVADAVALLELIPTSSTAVKLRLTTGGVTTEVTVTATLPASSTALQWEARVITQEAVAKNIRVGLVTGNTGGV
jgi:hypothetical protein